MDGWRKTNTCIDYYQLKTVLFACAINTVEKQQKIVTKEATNNSQRTYLSLLIRVCIALTFCNKPISSNYHSSPVRLLYCGLFRMCIEPEKVPRKNSHENLCIIHSQNERRNFRQHAFDRGHEEGMLCLNLVFFFFYLRYCVWHFCLLLSGPTWCLFVLLFVNDIYCRCK